MKAAFMPPPPPPITSTVAAATPGTPPSRMPRPPIGFSSMNAPARGAILPAPSLLAARKAQCKLGLGSEVQVGEERVALLKQRHLGGLRLLHLQDQLCLTEYGLGVPDGCR